MHCSVTDLKYCDEFVTQCCTKAALKMMHLDMQLLHVEAVPVLAH